RYLGEADGCKVGQQATKIGIAGERAAPDQAAEHVCVLIAEERIVRSVRVRDTHAPLSRLPHSGRPILQTGMEAFEANCFQKRLCVLEPIVRGLMRVMDRALAQQGFPGLPLFGFHFLEVSDRGIRPGLGTLRSWRRGLPVPAALALSCTPPRLA